MPKGKGKAAFRGKKGSNSASQDDDPMAFKRASRVNRITSAADAGFEGQDAFGLGDDEIALDGHTNGATGDFDDDLEEDEVLALNLPKSRRTYDEESDEDDVEAAAPAKPTKVKKDRLSNREKDLLPLAPKTRTSRLDRPTASTSKAFTNAEEEIEDESSSDDDEDSNAEEDTKADEAEFDDEWARTGGYHVTKREIARMEEQASAPGGKFSADEEAEQRDALELYEARRIQKEAKDKLDETDYIDEELDEADAKDEDLLAVARLDRSQRTPQTLKFDSREEAIAHLLSKEPELLALLDDFSACTERSPLIQQTVKEMQSEEQKNEKKIALGYLYQDTFTTYLTLLAFYLHIRSHPLYPAVGSALAGDVLSRLVKVRSSISTMDDYGIIDLPGQEKRKDMYADSDDEDELELEELDRESLMARIGELDDDELDALIAERQAILEEQGLAENGSAKSKDGKKRKAIAADSDSELEDEDEEMASKAGKKRRRQSRGKKAKKEKEASRLPLLNLEAPSVNTKGALPVSASTFNDDFVDPTSLSAAEASEKAGKTKSLRFYTSKIAATSARRAGAGKERGGGDDDVPYRSKERAREAALRRQQHAQGAAQENTDLDNADFDDADFAQAQQVNDNAPSASGYYDLVASRKKAAKEAKKEAYDEAALEERAAIASEVFDPKNPRAVNRMIMANKGLTPKRPKSVRNPRVKKRQRYEQAQKKVASMKPVYKGGLGSATYSGEKTGISSKVVKSRSL